MSQENSKKPARIRWREIHPLRDHLRQLMAAVGLRGRGAQAALARAFGVKQQTLMHWLQGSTPQPAVLRECIGKLKLVYPWVQDVEGTALWLPSAAAPRPDWLNRPVDPNDAEDPRRSVIGSDLEHRTPKLGTRTQGVPAMPPLVDPHSIVNGVVEDLRDIKDPVVVRARTRLAVAAKLMDALKDARNAGLAGIMIAGAMALTGCSRNSPQFGGEILSIDEVRRRAEERRRRHSLIQSSTTYARA